MLATTNAIESIMVVDRISGYTLKSGTSVTMPQSGKYYGDINGVKLYQNVDPESSEIYMVLGETKGIYSANTVYIGISSSYLAEADIYEEYTAANNRTIILLIAMLVICSMVIIYLIFNVTYKPIEQILSQIGDMAFIENESLSEVQYINHNLKQLKTSNNKLAEMVDEELYDYSILKLSIQPLIENIANHAVGEGHEKVHISISIK